MTVSSLPSPYTQRLTKASSFLGGRLKTPAEADSESLQAKWVSDLGELSLRASDVGPLVAAGRQHWAAMKAKEAWHPALLPAGRHHARLLLRLLICVRKKDK